MLKNFKAEINLNSVRNFGFYLTENTILLHYKGQLIRSLDEVRVYKYSRRWYIF